MAQVAPSLEELSPECIGFCEAFEVDSTSILPAEAAHDAAAEVGMLVKHFSRTVVSMTSRFTTLATCLQAPAADGATAAARALPAGTNLSSLMTFTGCPRPLACTVFLCGGTPDELASAKRVLQFAAYAAYWNRLESAFLSDQLLSAAVAGIPSGAGAGAAVQEGLGGTAAAGEVPTHTALEPLPLGMARSVARASFEAATAARGKLAITSASPHTRLYRERGAVSGLELPELAAEVARPAAFATAGAGALPAAMAEKEPLPLHALADVRGNGSGLVGSLGGSAGSLSSAADEDAEPASPSGRAAGSLPGLAIYGLQQLWLSISCKNPGKSTLCEPPHLHSMEYYGDGGELSWGAVDWSSRG